ncbi:unnamed protein product [Polarella glacialis]|uniref:Uncharacterized protein n=1 Tax=Polarella glacialis TaxID=89957 RepID=A0A813KUJ2_POLGL|nr:unnamed protein product [Polarella glacialis]
MALVACFHSCSFPGGLSLIIFQTTVRRKLRPPVCEMQRGLFCVSRRLRFSEKLRSFERPLESLHKAVSGFFAATDLKVDAHLAPLLSSMLRRAKVGSLQEASAKAAVGTQLLLSTPALGPRPVWCVCFLRLCPGITPLLQ